MKHSRFSFLPLLLLAPLSAFAFDPTADAVRQSITESVTTSVQTAAGEAVAATIHAATLSVENRVKGLKKIDGSGRTDQVTLFFTEKEPPRVWDFALGTQHRIADLPADPQAWLLFDAPTGQVVRISRDGSLLLRRSGPGETFHSMGKVQAPPTAAALSRGGGYLAVADTSSRLTLVDLQSGHARVAPLAAIASTLQFSADGSKLVLGDTAGAARVMEVASDHPPEPTLILTGGTSPDPVAVDYLGLAAGGGKELHLAMLSRDGALAFRREEAGRVTSYQKQLDVRATSFSLASRGNLMAIGLEDGNILFLHGDDGREVGRLAPESAEDRGPVSFVLLSDDGALVVSHRNNGDLVIRDVRDGTVLLQAVTTQNGWVAVDPNGRFDGSDKAMDDVQWLVKDQRLQLDRFSKAYYDPGLLAKYLHTPHALIPPGTFQVSKGIALPPTVDRLSLLNASRTSDEPNQIIIAARDVGGYVEDIELFHNGKRVSRENVIVDKTEDQGQIKVRAMAYQVDPTPGANEFRAVGVGLGGIEGQPTVLSETFSGSPKSPTLHLVVVGINQYRLPDLALNYAVPDATAVGSHYRGGETLFDHVETTLILDDKATRSSLEQTLRHAVAKAAPEDVVLVFLAGHAFIQKQEWMFIAQDLARVEEDAIRQSGLSASALQAILLESPAQKVMLMIDACYSGGAVAPFMQFAQRREHRLMGRSLGVGILTAARADQEAVEATALGHGLFTATILSGMAGKADTLHQDRRISAQELIRYAERQIPFYSTKWFNLSQIPVAYLGGEDFFLGSVKP